MGRLDGLRRLPGPVTHAASGPVLEPETPWEGLGLIGRNCILWDEEESRFKCWYPCYDPALPGEPVGARRRWAYAESADGVHWERPDLGLTPFPGSTANNLLRLEGLDESAAVLWSVAKDPDDPDPGRRYKAIGMDRHPRRPGEPTWTGPDGEDEWYRSQGRHMGCGLFVAFSADGLTWRQREGWAGSGALIMDNTILHGYDPHTRRWVLWQRPRILPKHRVIGVSFSPDFEDWTFPECVLAPDGDDPPDTQFDQLSTVAASDGGFVGLLSASAAVRADRGVTDIVPQLVYSRDARRWTRVDRGPFLAPKEPPPTWDDGCIIPFNPQTAGDEVFIFYYGKNAGHIWGEPTADGRVTRSAFGLVKLRRDRWVALTPAAGGEGTLTTSLITGRAALRGLRRRHPRPPTSLISFCREPGAAPLNADRFPRLPSPWSWPWTAGQRPGGASACLGLEDCDPVGAATRVDHRVPGPGAGAATCQRSSAPAACQPQVGRALVIRGPGSGATPGSTGLPHDFLLRGAAGPAPPAASMRRSAAGHSGQPVLDLGCRLAEPGRGGR